MNAEENHKDCVIVDICALNKIIMLNTYLMSLQAEILTFVKNITFISIINAASFFY